MKPKKRALRGNVFDHNCPSRLVLNRVTGRWGSLAMRALLKGTLRFAQLRDELGGISEKVLSETLRGLVQYGLVTRKAYPVIPPKVEYTLTPTGRICAQKLDDLIDWIEDHVQVFVEAAAHPPK